MSVQILSSQRHLFEFEEGVAYLNCAQTSPFLISVREAGYAGISNRTHPWHITSQEFFRETEEVRKLFGQLVQGDSERVALVPSASYGIATAALNVPLKAGEHILLLEGEFPSNYYAWKHKADKEGGEIRFVARPADHDWTKAILSRVDDKTAIISLPNCHWTDGSLVDLAAIRLALGDTGKPALVVDATQSLGAYPLAIEEIRPDFLTAVCYKWLMGPYTFGMLHVHERRLNGTPIEHNWINRKGSEDFTKLVDYQNDFQPGARRYDMGERANAILEPMAIAAVSQILSWGVPNIHHTIVQFTDALAKESEALGFSTTPKPYRCGHMIGIKGTKPWPDALKAELTANRVYVSFRGTSIRVAPHVYNSWNDIDRFLGILRKHV